MQTARAYKLTPYLLTLLFTMSLCIGTTYAGTLVKHECYLSNSAGEAVDEAGKLTQNPIYKFKWQVEDDAEATITNPWGTENLQIESRNDRRNISFDEPFCKIKTSLLGKTRLDMVAQWELQQDAKEKNLYHLAIYSDTAEAIMKNKRSNNATEYIHDVYCEKSTTKTETSTTKTGRVSKSEKTSGKESTLFDERNWKDIYSDSEATSIKKYNTPKNSVTTDSEGASDGDSLCSSASFRAKADAFWETEEAEGKEGNQ
ncbi:MAG: hypothetical protein K0R14_1588 [Burkholderiales bacterium]|jgi:hypothetical protein|nr:hypothetical protein [Burkholderiales bacterium]